MTQSDIKKALKELGEVGRIDLIQWLVDHGYSPNIDSAMGGLIKKKEVSYTLGEAKLGCRPRIYRLLE